MFSGGGAQLQVESRLKWVGTGSELDLKRVGIGPGLIGSGSDVARDWSELAQGSRASRTWVGTGRGGYSEVDRKRVRAGRGLFGSGSEAGGGGGGLAGDERIIGGMPPRVRELSGGRRGEMRVARGVQGGCLPR